MRYRYRLFGTTQALRPDGTAVPLGGPRLRALLTVLALAGGDPVRTDALVRDVWASDEEEPGDPPAAVQALVGRLRRVLGREVIASDAAGYRLAADRDAIDLFRFERLADDGARALAGGEPDRAAELLEEALGLWREPVLADLPGGGGRLAVRARDRWLAADRSRLAADCARGLAEAALPELRAYAAAYPLDETLHALHLRALRDTGRRAEALGAYAGVRSVLADRLGTEPGAELRALHAELLGTGDSPVSGDPDVSGDSSPEVGQERTAGERVAEERAPEPCAASRAHVPGGPVPPGRAPAPRLEPLSQDGHRRSEQRRGPAGGLRPRLTSFVGREADLAAIRADMAAARLVTLLGPGGAGKTRLSQEAADSLATRRADGEQSGTGQPPAAWPDGVWLAELAPVRDSESIAETVLAALGGRETWPPGGTSEAGLSGATGTGAPDPLTQLTQRCAGRRLLLLLDNCEHVLDAVANLVETLLVECPGITVLATSREPLGVPGEAVRPVEPLPDPVALRLLADRGAAARAGFRVADDPDACAEICRRLDGLPLAIELAAARLRALTPRQLADRLDDRFRLLTGGSRTVLPRQQTLRAVVDWSWELLDATERAVLRRLSVFSGGCELEQAELVCADDGLDESGDGGIEQRDVPALLGALVDKSLVLANPLPAGGMRYHLLETVGEYARERLVAAGDKQVTERRHLVAYRELARTTDPLLRGPRQRELLARLERDHDNIRTALRRSVVAGDEDEALCLVLSTHWFCELRGYRTDSAAWAKAAAALGPNPFQRPIRPAPSLRQRCTAIPPPMTPECLWEARREVWIIQFAAVLPDRAGIDSTQTRDQLRALSESYRPGQPQVCRPPAASWFFSMVLLGDHQRLDEVLAASVRGCRESGDTWELAMLLQLRGKMLNDHPDALAQSARDAEESLELFTGLGDQWGVAEALTGRGKTRERRGDLAGAAADYREAAVIAEELGAQSHVPMLRARLAGVLLESEDASIGEEGEDGERMLFEAIEMGERSGGELGHFERVGLAIRLGRSGRLDEARRQLDALREHSRETAPSFILGMIDGMDGWMEVRAENPRRALVKLRSAIARTRDDPLTQIVAPHLTAWWLASVAEALATVGRTETAARLLGAYDTHGTGAGTVPVVARESRSRAERSVRAALGDAHYQRLYDEGGGLSLTDATALAD
ncbi:AfsR/SARP family transcriptional regulator [Streptomyces oceani]|uniref:OmpR/PhoB-type domain-containing protein n=1 Tax=Streptomyces oceani TaxID=1075402 RepID=A0A1E7KEY2_9ACTN|nr:BTAD domain-containing putative transcriptional regulator [Streptomyces oceani]OEV02479.1 hypothetical protein AN216_16455 [Streptomyces oceani]